MSEKKAHKVLVVEDVDEISSNMAAALKKRGHEVQRVSNADEAIKVAEASRPAMILTDLDLPTFERLLELLREHANLKNMVVAIIDINQTEVEEKRVNVLRDFQALDDLIEASQDAT